MSEGDRALKKKVNSLERNLEQLTLMYHQLVSAKSVLKIDNQVNEKKLKRKVAKVNQLEQELITYREKIEAYKKKSVSMKKEREDHYRMTMIPKHTNIKRSIRGGSRNANLLQNKNIRSSVQVSTLPISNPLFDLEEQKVA